MYVHTYIHKAISIGEYTFLHSLFDVATNEWALVALLACKVTVACSNLRARTHGVKSGK